MDDAHGMAGSCAVERQLLAEIRAAPEAQPPRLVYADWLLAQPASADRERGELMRVQCELSAQMIRERRRVLRARERELLERLRPPSFGEGVRLELVWSRGFLEGCRADLADFARHRVAVFQLAPLLARLELVVDHPPNQSLLRALVATPALAQIRELSIAPATPAAGLGPGDALLELLVPALVNLERLRVTALSVHERGVASLEAASPRLATLDLSSNHLGPAAVRRLAALPRAPAAIVRLARCGLARPEIEALARAPWLADLEELELGDNNLRDPGARALAGVAFRRLRRLALGSCEIGPLGGAALVRSGLLARLHHLRLHGNELGDAPVIALASSRASAITDLDLQACAIGDAAVIALAETPNVRAARTWRLGGNPISDAGARAIAHSPHLRGLVRLELVGCQIGDDGAAALAASATPDRVLALIGNPITDAGAAALIESRAREVTVSGELLSEPVRARLRERFAATPDA